MRAKTNRSQQPEDEEEDEFTSLTSSSIRAKIIAAGSGSFSSRSLEKGKKKDVGSAVTRSQLDKLKQQTVFRSMKPKIAGTSAEALTHDIYYTPKWIDALEEVYVEMLFDIDAQRLVYAPSFKAHLILGKDWWSPEAVRISIEDYDLDTYKSAMGVVCSAAFLATAWSRLPENSKWYVVFKLKSRAVKGVKGRTSSTNTLNASIAGLRFKLEDKEWDWITLDDVKFPQKHSAGYERYQRCPRHFRVMYRELPRAMQKFKAPPKILLKELREDGRF